LLLLAGIASAESITIQDPLGIGTSPNGFAILFQRISKAVAGIVGALSTIMIIVSGIMYLTSAGNPAKMENAKKAFFYAIAGIVISLTAEAITLTITGILKPS